ncbi:MAG TPA: DNA mismatch repair protein MutS [Gemmatimonadaceae bacterium]|nr:DNA mismatch repair protein MutS [Gemmatimonadaceae bacterium]
MSTPLMQQYREIKSKHHDAILLFRMGDFYEMFFDDAVTASRLLGLTLTSRNNGGASEVPLAGVPVKAVSQYLRRLVEHGHRVAICEQVEDPKAAKGIVRREVVETVTPGAVFEDDLLDGARDNFLASVAIHERVVGISAADVSTGRFRLVIVGLGDAPSALGRLAPREILVATGAGAELRALLPPGVLVTERADWEFDPALARDALAEQFAIAGLAGLGLGDGDAVAVGAGGALLRYLRELQPSGLAQLARPSVERAGAVVPLDDMTRRNLELVESLRGGMDGTLVGVLDRTLTPMGARCLRHWLLAPLVERAPIEARLATVAALVDDTLARGALRTALDGVRDIERLAGKTAAGRAAPRELRALGDSLARLPAVAAALAPISSCGVLASIVSAWDAADDICGAITKTLVERPPLTIGDGETIAPGVDTELDSLRALRDGGKDAIASLQMEERTRTGISSLKVGYNRVFGYYIEVTRAHDARIPADYQRRQTLAGAERYVTPALKEFEERILTATERCELLERERFEALRARTAREITRLQAIATHLAALDALASLAEVAAHERYCRPELTDGVELVIEGGRHPVVERMMPRDQFIPNDVTLTPDGRLIVLTGPNMAGKSTILRQIGLIVLMAQAGSFVPATRATIGICDRIFTRVGASDNLVRGQSTFMVEMAETSAILHTATTRSLVLLDEIGRGTATWDGLSIAWAVSEHLHDVIGCKTVFATHYHELTQLANELDGVRNYSVAVREVGEKILFLHRLQPGGASRSYGIDVGRLAGLPPAVITRARALLRLLERGDLAAALAGQSPRPPSSEQLPLFTAAPHPAVERLRAIDADATTPMAALQLLAELTALVRDDAVQP